MLSPDPANLPPRWTLPELDDATREAIRHLSRGLGLPAPLARVLAARGLGDPEAARGFLCPKLGGLADPFELPDMTPAVARLHEAITRGQRVVFYGDYDVDGVTSLTLFHRLLTAYGADSKTFLPGRVEEGYGLSPEGVARCVETLRPELLVAVDCGTASVHEIAGLRAAGTDVLVFDHHEGKHERPPANALVNPKLGDDYHYLCSAGIAFKACHALLKTRPLPGFDLKDFLDVVALGTVADIVPLVRENRILVKRGLRQLADSRWPGVRALVAVAGIADKRLNPQDIGYKLGPRLNAAGRLASAQGALDLLLTDDPEHAAVLAEELNVQNLERRQVEARALAEAQAQLDVLEGFPRDHAAIVVGARGWHPGVVGIVAGRLMRTHHRPTLVVGFNDDGLGKGSGRSIEGLSLVAALDACGHLLDKHGGHEMAAGLSMREGRFPEFQTCFRDAARAGLTDEQLRPRLRLDAEVRLDDLDADFLSAHEELQPFGTGNYQPVFLLRRVQPLGEVRTLKDKHYKFALRAAPNPDHAHGAVPWRPPLKCIFFNAAPAPLPPPPWDVAIQVEANEWQGNVNLEAHVQAVRAAE